jgi:hypothetical protein
MTEHAENSSDESSTADGSLGDDLMKLMVALGSMVTDIGSVLNTAAPPCDGVAACPVCRAGSLIKNCPPEVGQHLTAATGSLLLALQAALMTDSAEEKPGFERISLVDEAEPDEADPPRQGD